MNETLQNLKTRRSVRTYLPKQVEKSALEAVLEAGTYAPTGSGTAVWPSFTVTGCGSKRVSGP